MNNFLKSIDEIHAATKYLEENNLVKSGLDCKNWEMVEVIPFLKDCDLCDLGSDGSIVIPNAVALNLSGRKCGIDLMYKENSIKDGVELFAGDLMATPFKDESFDIVTSLSVIEHEVDFSKFAREVCRILRSGGNAFISFDYWTPKPDYEKRKLYNLDWNILDTADVLILDREFLLNGMSLTSEIDWTVEDAVINPKYCSPADVSYTFSILNFIKK